MSFISKLVFLLLLSSLLFQKIAHAQQTFLIRGVVLEQNTKLRIALAEVKNKRTGLSVGSNDMGFFMINVALGDTLLVTKRNFEELRTVVANAKDLILFLHKGNLLNEVTIVGQTKKFDLENIRRDYKDKGSFYAGKPPLLSFLFSPLTAFYELFGKTPQQAKRFNRMYQSEIQATYIEHFFNKTLINKHTGLTGPDLDTFLINYRPDFEKVKNWTTYDGIKWINDSYKKFADTKLIK